MAGKVVEEEVEDQYMMQDMEIEKCEGDRRRPPDLLIDEATKAFILENPGKNMFNLTLTNYPSQDSLFLGRIYLGNENSYRIPFNLRIDYYSVGFIP
jgi:hypothetical protein